MPHYIEPQDSNGQPIDSKRVKVWYVMILGAVVATSESLDIAKRMVLFLDNHEEHVKKKVIQDYDIDELIFYKGTLKTHVYSAIPRLFMKKQRDWSETPNKTIQPVIEQPKDKKKDKNDNT